MMIAGQIGHPFVPELPGEEGREQGHLALSEVDQSGGPVDEHQRHGDRGVDRTLLQAENETIEEEVHSVPQVRLADVFVGLQIAGRT